jgi:hypothetical protein
MPLFPQALGGLRLKTEKFERLQPARISDIFEFRREGRRMPLSIEVNFYAPLE